MKNGVTSVVLRVFIPDTASTTGAGKTGLTSASSGLVVAVISDNEAAPTTYTAAGSTIEGISTLGTYAAPTATKCRFKEVDATNLPGVYELQLADARWSVANARALLGMVHGASGAAPTAFEVQLVAVDPQDAVKFGMTRVVANADQINASAAAAARLALSAAQMVPGTVDTAGFTPTTTAFEADDITEATSSHYVDRMVLWTAGALVGQVTGVTAYSLVGGRGRFTVEAMTEAPANNDTFLLV